MVLCTDSVDEVIPPHFPINVCERGGGDDLVRSAWQSILSELFEMLLWSAWIPPSWADLCAGGDDLPPISSSKVSVFHRRSESSG